MVVVRAYVRACRREEDDRYLACATVRLVEARKGGLMDDDDELPRGEGKERNGRINGWMTMGMDAAM